MRMFFQQDVFSVQMDNIKYIGKYIAQLNISKSTVKKCERESSKFILGNNHALAEPDTSPRQTRLIFSTWTVDTLLLSWSESSYYSKEQFQNTCNPSVSGFWSFFYYNWTFRNVYFPFYDKFMWYAMQMWKR